MLRSMFAFALCLQACGGPNSESDLQTFSHYVQNFPQFPHPELTPGSTCKNPDEYRYPERIQYCRRSVSTSKKYHVIENYDKILNYSIQSMARRDFKVDHYIPLCLGGGNQQENLWPQHESVYRLTDPIEQKLCILLQKGRLSQKEAIQTVVHAKNNLNQANKISAQLDAMLK